jgi:threonyl-tRNA synthetase
MENDLSDVFTIRHSAAHILAAAVMRLFPKTKYDIGPAINAGFYYDFDLDHKFSGEDLEAIECEMRVIVDENQPFRSVAVTREEARNLFTKNEQPYKLTRLDSIREGEVITLYRNGEFEDLCRGPHVSSTGEVKAFKLLSVAGCYYRGDVKNRQLQRIYGCAFARQEELDRHLEHLALTKERDHRRLGTQLKLFFIDDLVGPGLILWTPRGTILRNCLQSFISEELERQGYVQVVTPHIGKLDLFKVSGHFPYYKNSQFTPIIDREALTNTAAEILSASEVFAKTENGDVSGFLLKPMNCPMHVRLYASQMHSYRDLPVRMAEFGTVYRWEQSGELGGLTRVRGFTQDDAHIFCTEQQLESEIADCLKLVHVIFETVGISDYSVRLSLRDAESDKYIGDNASWEMAENALRNASKWVRNPTIEVKGEAAFYGPKIDFVAKDVLGREWQLGTIQIDYNLPTRFGITYVGADNRAHVPVMIHRAPFGSMERFCGILIEHFGGDFPLWMAPEQVRILPLTDHIPYADEVHAVLRAAKIRASVDDRSEKLGSKIRRAEMEKVPYLLVVGPQEKDGRLVSVRSRIQPQNDGVKPLSECLSLLREEIDTRRLPAKFKGTEE